MVQAEHEGRIPAQKGLLPVRPIRFEHVGQPLDLRVRYGGSIQIQNRGYATQAILPIQAISAKSRPPSCHPTRNNARATTRLARSVRRIPRRISDQRCPSDAYQCGERRIFRVLIGHLMTGVDPSMGKK